MTKIPDFKLFDAARATRLSEANRAHISKELDAYRKLHPVRTDVIGRLSRTAVGLIPSPYQPHFASMPAVLALAIAVMLGGGTSLAAENALPGEVLYPVKVEVNEAIQTAFAFSVTARANVEAELANRRLAEAEALAKRGTLTEETALQLSAAFEKHVDRAALDVEESEDSATSERAADQAELKAELSAHHRILSTLSEKKALNLSGLIRSVEARLEVRSKIEKETPESASVKSEVRTNIKATAPISSGNMLRTVAKQYAALKARAKNQIDAAAEAITKAKANVGVDALVLARASSQLSLASDLLTEADMAFDEKDTSRAFTGVLASIEASVEATVLAKASGGVLEDVEIHSLIPPRAVRESGVLNDPLGL